MMVGIYVFGFIAIIAGLLIHVLVWRVKVPRSPTAVLLIIFLLVGIAVNLVYVLLTSYEGGADVTLGDLLGYWLLVSSAASAYVCLYSAIEVDSPSLSVVNLINSSGQDGIELSDLGSRFERLAYIQSRLNHLMDDGMVRQIDGRLKICASGSWTLLLLSAFSMATGRKKGSG